MASEANELEKPLTLALLNARVAEDSCCPPMEEAATFVERATEDAAAF
jgi:hypothetical protein